MRFHFHLLSLLALTHAAFAQLPALPQPATSFGAAKLDDWLYVYGGNSGKAHEFHRECITGNLFRIRIPEGDAWETLPSDIPLLGAPMATHEGHVYRVGGMQALNAKGEKNDLHSSVVASRFDPAAKAWQPITSLPEPRSSHDVVILNGTMYVGGGWKLGGKPENNSGTWHATLLSLNLAEPSAVWTSQPQPFQRRALAMATHSGRIWFIGGMDDQEEVSSRVDWFDPRTKEWGQGPNIPESPMKGFGVAACEADGRLVVSPLSGSVYVLSDDASRWEEVAKLANPRFFHRLVPTTDGRVIAVGGSSRKTQILEPEFITLPPKAVSEERNASAVSTSDWPQWRGPNRDGVSTETGWLKKWPEAGPREIWRAAIGVGMSSCVLSADRVITQGNDGNGNDSIIALNINSGKEVWRHTFPCPTALHEMPIVPSGPGATPTIAAGKVYALSRAGDLICLDANTGKVAWTKQLVNDLGGKRPVYGYSQSPLVAGDRVFLDVGTSAGNSGSTIALNAQSGEIIWRNGSGEAGYSSARILERDGRTLVAMFKGEALDVFAPEDGRVLWSHRTTVRDFCNAATPAFVGHQILTSNTGTDQAALLEWDSGDTPNVHPVWTHKQFALLFNSAVLHDGALFGFNEKRRGHHEFTCLDAATGETRWVSDAVATGTFILADGHWIFLTRDGEVVLAPATKDGLVPIARFRAFEGKCYATPTLAGGKLFVRSNAGEIAAYDLKPETKAPIVTFN